SLVKVVDGVAYAAVGGELQAYDLVTGDLLQHLNLGGSDLTGLAHEGTFLYTLDAAGTLRAVDISVSGSFMVARGALTMPTGGKLFGGGGSAYIDAGSGSTGGFATADISDPSNPVLLSGVDANNVQGKVLAANGSGLALTGGSLIAFGGVAV